MASEEGKPKKVQRISQACDLCHRRSIRCRPSAEVAHAKCQNCYDFAVDCTYHRPSRRRRHPSHAHSSPSNVLPAQHAAGTATATSTSPSTEQTTSQESNATPTNSNSAIGDLFSYTGARDAAKIDNMPDVAWQSFAIASNGTIEKHINLYLDMVYPLFPLFHGPSLRERLQQREHLTDRGFFASVMAACALTAARVRDGAIDDQHRVSDGPASEIFFAAAQDAIGNDFSQSPGLGSMRACALLSVTAIQYGQIQRMNEYLGKYMTLRAMLACHDERQWPVDLSIIEREERRRLYWAMYAFDIFTSVVFDGLMWSQETHSNVRYPVEVNDEDLTVEPASPHDDEHWLRGWNFTTDLYRMLEHSVKRKRRHTENENGRLSVTNLLVPNEMPDSQVMDNVLGAYYELPARFRATNLPLSGDRAQNLVGFQAANIQTTLQLVRMTLFSAALNNDVDQKCYVAEQVLTTFHTVTPRYLRAISTPLVYHLGRIGRILASVMEGLLSELSYQRVRALLVLMADVLSGLESGLLPTAGASKDLRTQVQKIDRYMDNQRHILSSVAQQVPSSAFPATNGAVGAVLSRLQTLTGDAAASPGPLAALDEFQLPPDLVNGEVWPWPFEFGQDAQMPIILGFE
ncbi:hypothetical protein LTR53_002816 [Teratosphaeriaceae sp. CCFEE 6253]|nr:hypothetical protein LTR53_002816 [Teratosphaeriaceae sp. CCFEE 6253]